MSEHSVNMQSKNNNHLDSRKTGNMVNLRWWPNQVNLKVLKPVGAAVGPLGEEYDYAHEFSKLDMTELKLDLEKIMKNSQDWWPADYGHYGALFIRMAWHSAGTYRIFDGRGGASSGTQRFAPLNSWPDNANLDKARRLLWPIKKKYGNGISWADLMILAGNVALESMGFKTMGFGGGRKDQMEPEEDIYWGPELEWLDGKRKDEGGEWACPFAAVQMGLIYVNPEGPDSEPDPAKSALDVRDTFSRMGMDDYETVALVAGGHTFGKGHGAGPEDLVGPEPEKAAISEMGFGWVNSFGTGKGKDTTTAGFEGAWTPNPTEWDHSYFEVLLGYEWEKVSSPAGHIQWQPKPGQGAPEAPMIGDPQRMQPLMMTTADISLKVDPAYAKISNYFLNNPEQFEDAFSRAWFKLTHRDMGPVQGYLGKEVPSESMLWQDPIPNHDGPVISAEEIDELKKRIVSLNLSISALVSTAWASASTYRVSDKRGGANGARIRLLPQRNWEINCSAGIRDVIEALEAIQSEFNATGVAVSLADLIVLGGCVAIEKASGFSVPFTPGRTDTTQELTDVESFAVLEPKVDGFRNYKKTSDSRSTEELLIDKAALLNLTAPEMTVLVGGLRVLGVNAGNSKHGLLTDREGILSNDYFVNLLDMKYEWQSLDFSQEIFAAVNRESGLVKYTGTRVDLLFGSNSILRGISEIYAQDDANETFIRDFISAWDKVMNLDRVDLKVIG